MASGKLSIYNLGSVGVDLSKSPIHKDDGSLVSAQNAVPDIRDEAGGLAKRDGLVAINSSALGGGSVQGAVYTPLTLGSSIGTGRVYAALVQTGTEGTNADYGWAHSADAFATGGTLTTTLPSPAEVAMHLRLNAINNRRAVTVDNKIYYSRGNGNTASYIVTPAIRVFDGTVDREFARLPTNPDDTTNSFALAITCMFAVGTTIYISVWNDNAGGAETGSVYSLDTVTGVITQVGATFTGTHVPGPLAWHLGRLWVGSTPITPAAGNAYFIRPGIDTAWTTDESFAVAGPVRDLMEFQGSLFASVGRSSYGVTGTIYKRSPTDGSWSSSESAATSWYPTMVVFKDNLYSIRDTAAANLIRKYDGTSWTTVYTEADVAQFRAWWLFQFNGTVYAFKQQADSTAGSPPVHTITDDTNDVIASTDGSTWSAYRTVSTGLTASVGNVAAGIYI